VYGLGLGQELYGQAEKSAGLFHSTGVGGSDVVTLTQLSAVEWLSAGSLLVMSVALPFLSLAFAENGTCLPLSFPYTVAGSRCPGP
jgi:hypothetical protein